MLITLSDIKINIAKNDILKNVSKTDEELFNLYVKQEKIINNLEIQINNFKNELRTYKMNQ